MVGTVSSPVYTDIPVPLGAVVAEYRIAPGTAIAYPVAAGQCIQIIDVSGSQCSDFIAFAADDPTEMLDSTVTRTLNGLAIPQVGLHGKYFSNKMRPLVETIQDTCGRHDSFMLACANKYYEDIGYPGHPSCSENFNLALAPHGIPPRPGWAAINFFFNTEVDCTGAIAAAESWSRPGDYVLLQAHQDLICASSACPDDVDPANGWCPTEIHVRIYAANQPFPRAIGRRATPDTPVRLTQPSAFTPCIQALTQALSEYNGFWVPDRFTHHGIHDEYWALRERVVMMDLSALRKFDITGPDALNLLQQVFSRNVAKFAVGQSGYGCLLNDHGGMVDDGIVFRCTETDYRYVGNCDSDAAYLNKMAQRFGYDVTIRPSSQDWHNLSVQGPQSRNLLRSLTELSNDSGLTTLDDLGYFRFANATVGGIPVILSRTGYTGELGYELFVHPSQGAALWQAIAHAGESYDLRPMGMDALDRARIEAGLLSPGIEFHDLISPYQAGIGWAVAMKSKPEFIGRPALAAIKPHPPMVAVGLVLDGNEVAAHGQCIHPPGDRGRVGGVTSATFSPILNRSIVMAQVVPEVADPGTMLEIGLMDGLKRRISATVGPLAAFDPTKSRVRV
jgi:aminomethyltransferase